MENQSNPNVQQVVPFFAIADMQASVRFYVDGLGFQITKRWIVDDQLRWCWLELGGAALMLQQFPLEGHDSWRSEGQVGQGVSLNFICQDALAIYHALTARGIPASRPFVGNGMWVTSLTDPDGYHLHFESLTDVAEGTEYSA